jgi:hypothetical protein
MDRHLPGDEIYDPHTSGALVRAHRPVGGGAASDVVSDAVWTDVLGLLRWAAATLSCSAEVRPGVAWRTATTSATLLRELPALCDERGECWWATVAAPVPGRTAEERLHAGVEQLWTRLRAPGDGVPLCVLAAEVDEVGAAAVAVLAEGADWRAVS